MTSAEGRLKAVEEEIASIRKDLSKPAVKELPTGSVISGERAIAFKVDSIHSSRRDYPGSKSAQWITIFGDSTGGAYDTLAEVLDRHAFEFANYQIIRRGFS